MMAPPKQGGLSDKVKIVDLFKGSMSLAEVGQC
jgi:hypothetical protein